ncbi:MAG: DUF3990 domain-containing protein [Clostridia bacterium]|nr:DUF3990 domain-containing protein [Clostridia bacterium]
MKDNIILYHGSKDIIKEPVFGYGNTENDYGLGFYCTEYLELAQEWACSVTHGGYANQYSFDTRSLKVLDLSSPVYISLNWIAILVKYRGVKHLQTEGERNRDYLLENFLLDINPYDIITGYRADDSYFSIARRFLGNGMPFRVLQRALKLGLLGEQTVLKSKIAFTRLKFEGSIGAPQNIYLPKRQARDKKARDDFEALCKEPEQPGDLLMSDIRRLRLKADDPRLR